MEITVGKTSGFCYGINNAVENAEKELAKGEVYCLGEIAHNKQVLERLSKNGLITIQNIEEAKGKTMVRPHGIAKEVYENAKKNNIKLIDLTCPKVLKVHNIAEQYCKKGYYIFLTGKKGHPEIIGTLSFCGKNSTVISEIEEIEEAVEKLIESKIKKLLIISQTTYNIKTFDYIVKQVKERVSDRIQVKVKNTICQATELRQKETDKISKEVELMIIVGGRNSANTNKLYEISSKNCNNVIFAENKNDIDISEVSKFQKIGLMAGASTPKETVEEIIKMIDAKKEEILI